MSGPAPSPDLFLARKAAAGHQEAWDHLIEQYGRRLFNLAFQFSGNREDAEDLTQEIFLRLHLNLKSYRGDVPLIGWALRLSRNLCIDHYRKMRRERSWHRVADGVLEQLAGHSDVEAESQRRQHLGEIYAALGELPEEHAEAVLLCDLQGLSLEEAASYLDVPLGTVKSRLHRGRQRLTGLVRARILPASPASATAAGASGGSLPC